MTHTPRLTSLFVFAVLLLLPACAAGAGRSQDGAQRALDGSKLAPAQAEAREAGEQKIFRGSVADHPARMTLRRSPSGELNGSYAYDGRGGELTLKGSVDAKGNFTLEEFDGAKKTGAFKGTWDEKDYEPEASLYGDWTKPTGGDTQYFYFAEQPAPSGGHAVETKQINEVNKKRGYRINVDYPQIEGAEKFNALAAAFATKEAADFRAAAGRQPGEKDYMPEAADDSLDVRYFVRSATPEIISVEFQMDYYEHGAAHGSHAFHVINYDARAGRELKLAELFTPGSDYLKRISEVAIKQVRRWNKDSADYSGSDGQQYLDDEDIKSGAAPDAENYQNWTITPRGLAVTFDYYQLGPYAAGAQKVVLPYADLKDVIKPNGPLAPFLK
ncbi:MAG TPA: RsiV family protein [Pyrinomonadaceae bacterium]|nr:RsiV family protein [Pyrinomonadaceae bacterium]